MAKWDAFRLKANQSLLGAESEFAAGRFNTAIALAYYACYQMGIAAQVFDGEKPVESHPRGCL